MAKNDNDDINKNTKTAENIYEEICKLILLDMCCYKSSLPISSDFNEENSQKLKLKCQELDKIKDKIDLNILFGKIETEANIKVFFKEITSQYLDPSRGNKCELYELYKQNKPILSGFYDEACKSMKEIDDIYIKFASYYNPTFGIIGAELFLSVVGLVNPPSLLGIVVGGALSMGIAYTRSSNNFTESYKKLPSLLQETWVEYKNDPYLLKFLNPDQFKVAQRNNQTEENPSDIEKLSEEEKDLDLIGFVLIENSSNDVV